MRTMSRRDIVQQTIGGRKDTALSHDTELLVYACLKLNVRRCLFKLLLQNESKDKWNETLVLNAYLHPKQPFTQLMSEAGPSDYIRSNFSLIPKKYRRDSLAKNVET